MVFRLWGWVAAILSLLTATSIVHAEGTVLAIDSMTRPVTVEFTGSEDEVTFTLEYESSICSSLWQTLPATLECVLASVSYIIEEPSGSLMLVKVFHQLDLELTESLMDDNDRNWLDRRLYGMTQVCYEVHGNCSLTCTANRTRFREPMMRDKMATSSEGVTRREDSVEFSTLEWDLRLNTTTSCLDVSKRNEEVVWNLLCSEKLSPENMVLDYSNWILFYSGKRDGSSSGSVGLMSMRLETGEERVAIGEMDFGRDVRERRGHWDGGRVVAADAVGMRVYWLTNKSVNSIGYPGVGVSVPVLLYLLDVGTRNTMLTYEEGSVYWMESKGDGGAARIVKLDVGGKGVPVSVLELSRVSGVISGYVVGGSVKGETGCEAAQCSHHCSSSSEVSGESYRCWCPRSLPVLLDGHNCGMPKIVVATTRESDPHRMLLDYALPPLMSASAPTHDDPFPILDDVVDGNNFVFAVNSRIRGVCWASGEDNPAKCKIGSKEPFVIASSKIGVAKESLLTLDFENDTDTVYWSSRERCMKLSSLRNVHQKAHTFGCAEVDTYDPYVFWPFSIATVVCNNKVGKLTIWFHHTSTSSMTTPFEREEGNCTAVSGNYIGTVNFIHGRTIKAINVQDMFNGRSAEVIWETDYYGGHSMEYNSNHLFWVGFKPEEGFFVDMIRTDVYVIARGSKRIFRSPAGTRIHRLRIFEPVVRLFQNIHSCRPNNCSHYCVSMYVLFPTRDTFKCLCPDGLVLKDRFTCGEPPEEVAPEGSGLKSSLWAVVIILPSLLVLVIILAVLYQYRKRQRIARQSQTIQELLQGNQEAADRARDEMEKVRYLPFTKIIPEQELVVYRGKILGEGNFGVVYEGEYDNQAVAVKTLKNCRDLQMVSEFVLELKIMAHVGYHDNIVQFFGAETSKVSVGKMLVVLEMCPNGCLESYLKKNCKYYCRDGAEEGGGNGDASRPRVKEDSPIILNLNVLLSWGRQLARGMAFLEERHVVHGDLATRNVLVFNDNVIKISDFGFARNLYQYTTYVKTKQVPLPWRWGALETLERFEFSVKSDVWAYGVTLWEIFTLGKLPFPEDGWTLEFVERLRQGLRLPEDDVLCKRIYKDVMLPCWRLNPDTRPEFKTIEEYFCSRAVNSEITM